MSNTMQVEKRRNVRDFTEAVFNVATEPYATLELVTPELAAQYLERNTNNRKIRPTVVNKYGLDMFSGNWLITHQGIAFAKDGSLIDGQHRLLAVVNFKVPVRMFVFRNVEQEAQLSMDTHAARNAANSITLSGLPTTTQQVSVANVMMFGNINAAKLRVSSNARKKKFIEKHMKAIDFAIECLKGKHQASVKAVFAKAYYTSPHDRLLKSGQILITGFSEDESDKTMIVLRNFLLANTHNGVYGAKMMYQKTQRMLWGYLNGEILMRCIGTENDYFPIEGSEDSE